MLRFLIAKSHELEHPWKEFSSYRHLLAGSSACRIDRDFDGDDEELR